MKLIRVALFGLLFLASARAAHANVEFVDENRKVDDVIMTVAFKMPSGASTQRIKCPGSLISLKALAHMSGDVSIQDNKGRSGVLHASSNTLEFSKKSIDQLRQDPKSDSFQFFGSPGTWIELQCLNVALEKIDAYSWQYLIAIAEIADSAATCKQLRFEKNYAYFSCGYGFHPPYGCRRFDEESRIVCYHFGNPPLDKWRTISPEIADLFGNLDVFSNDARIREFVKVLNNTAANGDPYYEVSTAAVLAAEAENTQLQLEAENQMAQNQALEQSQRTQQFPAQQPAVFVQSSGGRLPTEAKMLWIISLAICAAMVGSYLFNVGEA